MLQVHPHVCWLSHVKSEISVIFPVKSSYHQDNKPPPDGWGEINRLMLEDPWRAQPDTIVQHSWNFSDDDTPVRYHLPGVGPVFFSTTRTWPAERHQRNWSTSNAGNSSHVWLLEDRTVAVQNMVCWRYGMFSANSQAWMIIHLPSGSCMAFVWDTRQLMTMQNL